MSSQDKNHSIPALLEAVVEQSSAKNVQGTVLNKREVIRVRDFQKIVQAIALRVTDKGVPAITLDTNDMMRFVLNYIEIFPESVRGDADILRFIFEIASLNFSASRLLDVYNSIQDPHVKKVLTEARYSVSELLREGNPGSGNTFDVRF